MTSESNQENASSKTKRDFSNYLWITGAKKRFDALCLSATDQGRVFVALRGWDKKQGAPGSISVEISRQGLRDLRDAITCVLDAPHGGAADAIRIKNGQRKIARRLARQATLAGGVVGEAASA